MTLGLITSFIITFTLIPTLISFYPSTNIFVKNENNSKITTFFQILSLKFRKYIFAISSLVIILSLFGISKLEVENSFINYFSKKTEIYKGMKLIDEELGGTTPLDIILKFPENHTHPPTAATIFVQIIDFRLCSPNDLNSRKPCRGFPTRRRRCR